MKRRDREIRTDEWDDSVIPDAAPKRRRDTDLSEPSVRKSRRQLRREEESAERAPWDDPAQGSYSSNASAQHDANIPSVKPAATPEPDEPDEPDEETKKPRKNTFASVLSGNILSQSEVRRAYPYMIFVACLMFLYIANVFRTQYIYRQHATLTEQVKELRAKSMTIASERMQATQQSNIMIELERRGIPLRESLEPNKVIPNPKRNGEETNNR